MSFALLRNVNDMKKATILVNSCDSYEDAWYPFFTLLDKYWPDCPYDIVLNTESKDFEGNLKNLNISSFNLYNQGQTVPYGRRIREHLKRIKTDYVITLMDDFFVRSPVNTSLIRQVIEWMDSDPQIASFCLISHDDRHSCRYGWKEMKYDGFNLRPRFTDHNYDMQASIWRTDILYRSWKDYMSPWEWESVGNYRSFDDGFKYYDLDKDMAFPINYLDYQKEEWSGIRKGKWVAETVCDLFKENGIVIDYSIRGFFNASDTNISKKKNFLTYMHEIRCYGIKRFLPASLYRMRKKVFKCLFKKELPLDYCDYLRHKYYDKV